jgi:hypothetical protein
VFLDACIDPRVAELLTGHEVKTAFEMDWHRLKDHVLLPLVQDRFDAFVTADRGVEHEHNLKKFRFGILIVHVAKNKVEFYRPLLALIQIALEKVRPGDVLHVRSGEVR